MQLHHPTPLPPQGRVLPPTPAVFSSANPQSEPPNSPILLEDNRAALLIRQKHDEYARASRRYRALYYAVRLSAGLSAGYLPFVVTTFPLLATILSCVIVTVTVVDMVFAPKDRWKLFSRAADLITLERLKRTGENQGYETLLSLLTSTESAKLESLVTLEEVTKRADDLLRR